MNSVAWVMATVKVFPSDSRKGGGGKGGGSARAYSTDVHDAQCMMHSAWCAVHDAQCMMRSAWCAVHDAQCMKRSAWSAVHGAQCNTKESPCYFELIEKF